jgi:hypothetical protein
VRDGKAGAPLLARLLSSAGAQLAESERNKFQAIIDGVKGKRKHVDDAMAHMEPLCPYKQEQLRSVFGSLTMDTFERSDLATAV